MNNKKYTRYILLDAKHNEFNSRRQRSNSDEFDNKDTNENKSSFFFQKIGYDNRYNYSENNDVVINITQFIQQMELLKKLENKNISEPVKMDLIDNYKKDYSPSIGFNIYEGGLFKDWNFDL
jgi:hypothetical protein